MFEFVNKNDTKGISSKKKKGSIKTSIRLNRLPGEKHGFPFNDVRVDYKLTQPIQRKKILNIASGTDLNYLMPSAGDDIVTNTDRGDMLYLRFVVEHYDFFRERIEQELSECNYPLRPDSKETNVNKWFYNLHGGDMHMLWEMITSAERVSNINELVPREQELYWAEPNKYFSFGTVLDEIGENRYDIIKVVSGFNVPVMREDYANKIYRLLKDGGQLIVCGNPPCLKTNGITLNTAKSGIGPITVEYHYTNLFSLTSIENIGIRSQHTLMPEEVQGIYQVVFNKK